jgi:predicted Na+-dependent transporter
VSERGIDRGSGLAIPLLVYAAVANADVGAIDGASVGSVAAVVLLLLGGVFVAIRVGGNAVEVDRSTYLPVFFTGGLKNLGIALAIAFTYASATVVVVIVTYYVLQQLVGALVSDLG